jgi:hypothetical protein
VQSRLPQGKDLHVPLSAPTSLGRTRSRVSLAIMSAGETEGLNVPATAVPYTFTITGSSAQNTTLTVKTVR